MSAKDVKMILAADIVKNPDKPIEGKYRTVWDVRTLGATYDNLERAMVLLGERGWRPILFIVDSSTHAAYMTFEKIE